MAAHRLRWLVGWLAGCGPVNIQAIEIFLSLGNFDTQLVSRSNGAIFHRHPSTISACGQSGQRDNNFFSYKMGKE